MIRPRNEPEGTGNNEYRESTQGRISKRKASLNIKRYYQPDLAAQLSALILLLNSTGAQSSPETPVVPDTMSVGGE